jgi:hypothetical protein
MASCTFPRKTFLIVNGKDADHDYPVTSAPATFRIIIDPCDLLLLVPGYVLL